MDEFINVPVVVRVVPLEDRVKTTGTLRKAFRHLAEELTVQPFKGYDRVILRRALRGFEVHHALPRMLGGKDDYSNLTLCDPVFHKKLHEIIDAQIVGLKTGEERLIYLPACPSKVWGLDADSIARSALRPDDKAKAIELLQYLPR